MALSLQGFNAQISFTTEIIPTSGQYNICAVDMNGDYLDDIVSVSGTNIQVFTKIQMVLLRSKTLPQLRQIIYPLGVLPPEI